MAPIKSLIPVNCLCTSKDKIPGIANKYLPHEHDELLAIKSIRSNQLLMDSAKLHIADCTIELPNDFEQYFIENAKTAYGETVETSIGERRLVAGVHNKWCFVNKSKLKNSITLTVEEDTLRCNGTLVVDNVYRAEGLALVFLLEYTLRFFKVGCEDEYKQVVLGDLVYALEEVDKLGYTKVITLRMNTDPNLSITGTKFWSLPKPPKDRNWTMTFNCVVSSVLLSKELLLQKRANASNVVSVSIKPQLQTTLLEKKPRDRSVLETKSKKTLQDQEVGVGEVENKVERSQMSQNMSFMQEEVSVIPEEIDLQKDLDDPLKVNSISISFISFSSKRIRPEKLCFSFKFFTFPIACTQSVVLKYDKEGMMELDDEVRKWSNIVSYDKRILKLNFNFDPTATTDTPQNMQSLEFFNYLTNSILRIWVWNADGLIPLGSMKIRLYRLLRKGVPGIRVKQEVEVLSESNNIIGKIMLHIENIGRQAKDSKMRNNETMLAKSMITFRKNMQAYNQPLTLKRTTRFLDSTLKEGVDEEQKIGMAQDYSICMSISANKRGISFWGEKEKKTIAEKYYPLSHTIDINKVLHRMTQENIDNPVIYYSIGRTTAFPFLFFNTTGTNSTFSLTLDNPEGNVSIVRDPDEWRFLCIEERYEPPTDFDALYDTEAISLKSGDHLLIILKIRTEIVPKTKEQTLRLVIKNNANNEIEAEKEFKVKYKETYYDSYYVMNVPENQTVGIRLNTDLHKDYYKHIKAVRSNGKSKFDWLSSEDKLVANFEAPESPKNTQLLFYLYSDEYYYHLLSIIYVEIRSYKYTEFTGIVAKEIEAIINIPKQEGVQIELKASNKKEIMLNGKYEGIINCNKDLVVPISIRSFRIGMQQLLLHCLGMICYKR